MTLLRLMLTTFVLLAQAWPLQAAGAAHENKSCETGCCAWLVEAGMSACACPEPAKPATPAGTPPAGARDLVPQVTWVVADDAPLPKREGRNVDATLWQRQADEAGERPHVRLAVLFCSFLN